MTATAPIIVRRRPGLPTQGVLTLGGYTIPVALGRGGLKANKREGDGGTPIGTFRPLRLWWRKDRHTRPKTALPVRIIGPNDGWCEDPESRHYNRPIRLAAESNADRLMRADHLYDFIIEIDQNTRLDAAFARATQQANADCCWIGHDPEKWAPVFGPDHAQEKTLNRLRAMAEDRRADANVRGAHLDGRGKIGAHAHRQQFQSVARSDLCGQREVRRRRILERRDAHQP
jgi:hypothetical protein